MAKRKIQWTTDPHVVKTIADDSFGGWEKAFVEAIKNSLDAKASRVDLEVPTRDVLVSHDEQIVVVEDNGNGMSFDELKKQYCTFGRFKPSHRGTGKVATFVVAARVELDTWRDGKEHRISFSTADIIDSREGRPPKSPVEDVSVARSGSGTRLTLTGFSQQATPPSVQTINHILLRHFHHQKGVQFFINGSRFVASEHALPALKTDRHELKGVGTLSLEVLISKQKLDQPGLVVYHEGQSVHGPDLFGLSHRDYRGDAEKVASRLLGRIDIVTSDPAPISSGAWALTPQFKAVEKWVGERLEEVVDRHSAEAVDERVDRWLSDERTRRYYNGLGDDERATARRILCHRAKRTAGNQGPERVIARLVCHSLATKNALQVVLDVLDDSSLEDVESFSELFKGKDRWTLRQVTRAASLVKHYLKAVEDLENCVADYTKNEAAIHEILKENPWIIADDYHSFRSNRQIRTTLKKLFGIDTEHPQATCRPDLFFVLGDAASSSLEQPSRFLFIELKGPDQPLADEHQNQVVRDARTIMKHLPGFSFCVLLGTELSSTSPPDREAEAKGVYTFRSMTYQQLITRARFRLMYMVEGVKETGAEELARKVLIAQVEGLAGAERRSSNDGGDRGDAGDKPFRPVTGKKLKPYVNAVPLYDLRVSAGAFSPDQIVEPIDKDSSARTWVAPRTATKLGPAMFVAQVVGESMNRRAPNGSWCLFRASPADPEGRAVLIQHRDVADPDFGGQYTLKLFAGEYEDGPDGTRLRRRIVLKPDSTDPACAPMTLEETPDREVTIIAEMIEVLT